MSVALPSRPLFALLQEDFDTLTDPRVERTRLHRLSDLLLLSLAAFCCGAESFEDIQVWSLAHGTDALRMLLGVRLENGIPHHDTFRRVLGRLAPACLEESLLTLRRRLPGTDAQTTPLGKHVAMDGKEIRGSHDAAQGTGAVLLLSLFATEVNLVIGQRKVDAKTNEIPVAQEILSLLNVEGTTVTADALHCQVRTAAVIREGKADYVLAVKDNQKGLHDALQSLFTANKVHRTLPMTTFCAVEKGHGRIEARHGYLIGVDDWLPAEDPLRVWQDWHSVLCIESERRWSHRGQEKVSQFTRYFISNSTAEVQTLMGLVRSHWKIENNLHWIMDVTFGEDACRVRTGQGAQNLATLRRLSAYLLQATEPEEIPASLKGMSLRKRKKWAGWRTDYLHKVLNN